MPWKESVAMDERLKLVRDALSDWFTMSELCARYGVSRRVGYKSLARYDAEGRRPRRPESRPSPLPPQAVGPAHRAPGRRARGSSALG